MKVKLKKRIILKENIKIQLKYIYMHIKKIFSKTLRDIVVCPKCGEIITNAITPYSCPKCNYDFGITWKVIDIKWIIILIIAIITLFTFSIKIMLEHNHKMILIKESKERWTYYQFLIDSKGKKHIKIISSDLDWMQNDELIALDFSEDNIPPNLNKEYPEYFVNWLKSQFNDKSNWK